MASPEVISLVVDKIVAAFDGDVVLFESWLSRSRLETDVTGLQSQIRQANTLNNEQQAAAALVIGNLQAQLAAKLAEIDALGQ